MPKVHLCSFSLRNGATIFHHVYKNVRVHKSSCFSHLNWVTSRFAVTVATARNAKRHDSDKSSKNLIDVEFIRNDDYDHDLQDSNEINKFNRQLKVNSSSNKFTKDKEEDQYQVKNFKIIQERILENIEYEIEEDIELYKIIKNDIYLNNVNDNDNLSIPLIPTKIKDINELDEIIKKLSQFSINNRDKQNNDIISEIFKEIINSNLLTIESYNIIIQFYCKNYDFKNVEILFNKLLSKETNVYPNINTYNLIFNYLSRGKNNKKLILSRFKNFNKYLNYLINNNNIKINSFSLLIFFKNFNNKIFKKNILSFINYKKFNVEPIICDIIKFNIHNNNSINRFNINSINEILNFYNIQLNSDILLFVIDKYINRMQDPVKAWEYLIKNKDISIRCLDKLINLFLNNYIIRNEIYNCIAIINLFKKNFPDEFKDDNGLINIKLYKKLYESMINLKNFNNWISLTKFFYFKSLIKFNDLFNNNENENDKNDEKIEKLIKFGKLNYDLKFEISDINIKEIKIMEIINNELIWENNKPIKNLNDNNKKFIKFAKLVNFKLK